MRYLVKRIPNTSLVHYDGSKYYCEIAGGADEKASVNTSELLAGSKYLDCASGTWYVYDELTDGWAVSKEGGSADPEVIAEAVSDWLDDHPEATTTVQDGSVTYAKLDTTMKGKVDEISSLSDETSNLKSAFDSFSGEVKEEIFDEIETEITKTSQTDGTYIRYYNDTWQTLENNANYRLMEYPAQGGREYHLVNGSIYKPYVPAVIFYHDNTILGSSAVPTEQTWKGEKVASLYFVTPADCNKILTNNFGNPMAWTPALYEISYTGKVTELDGRVSSLEGYDLNTKVTNLQKIAKAVYLDQTNISFGKGSSNAIVITLPYRMTIFGGASFAMIKQFDTDVSSGTVTYTLPNDSYLIYDLDTSETVITDWSGFTNTYTNCVYLAFNHSGNISSGILHPYWNTYNVQKLDSWQGTLYPPEYYFTDDYLQAKATGIRNESIESTVSFAFITDVHVRQNHLNAFKLIKYIDDRTNAIPFVIFGGDIHASDGNAMTEVLKDCDTWLNYISLYGKNRVFQCKGNHDINTVINGTTNYAGLDAEYYYLRKNTEQIVDNPNVSTLYGSKTMFYSFDDDVNKIRYIILDDYDGSYQDSVYNAMGISRAQADWLIEKLNESTGYNCIVVSHETSDSTMTHYVEAYTPIQKILEAFANKETLEYTGQGVYVSADFTDTQNTLVCHLSGHAHVDESHVSNGVLSIATVCDALYPRPTAYGTVNEQAFDVFCINTANKTIHAIRVGGGSDRSWTYGTTT